MQRAKVLTLEEAIEWRRETVWIQLREMSCAIQAQYALEHAPWLRFRDERLQMEITVKAENYGKTWRCFDICPLSEDSYPWEDGEKWTFSEEEADAG